MGQLTMIHFLIVAAIRELGGKAKLDQIYEKLNECGDAPSKNYVEHLLFELSVEGIVKKTDEGEWVINE